jgi:hypothetical protein
MRRHTSTILALVALLGLGGCSPLPSVSPAVAADRALGRVVPRAAEVLGDEVLAVLWLRQPQRITDSLGLPALFASEPILRSRLGVESTRLLGLDLTDARAVSEAGVDLEGEFALAWVDRKTLGLVVPLRDPARFERACVAFHARTSRFVEPRAEGGARVYGKDPLAIAVREHLAFVALGPSAVGAASRLGRAPGRGRLADSPRFSSALRSVQIDGAERAPRDAAGLPEGAFYVDGRAVALLLGVNAVVVSDVEASEKRLEAEHAEALDRLRSVRARAEDLLDEDAAHRARRGRLRRADEAKPKELVASALDALAGTVSFTTGADDTAAFVRGLRIVGNGLASPWLAKPLDATTVLGGLRDGGFDASRLAAGTLSVAADGIRVRALDLGLLLMEVNRGRTAPEGPPPTSGLVGTTAGPLVDELDAIQAELDASVKGAKARELALRHARATGKTRLAFELLARPWGYRFDGHLEVVRGGLALALREVLEGVSGAVEMDPRIERAEHRRREHLERRRAEVLDRLYAPQASETVPDASPKP